MSKMKRLPDSEYDVMKAIWETGKAASFRDITLKLKYKGWKQQTMQTLLTRMVRDGFLDIINTENGRLYNPLINEEDYLRFETGKFISRYFNNSFASLVNTLFQGGPVTDQNPVKTEQEEEEHEPSSKRSD